MVRKLSEVMALVDRVPKNGRNEFHKYDYATEADILDAVRGAMAERRLIMVPSGEEAKSEPRGDKGEHVFTLRSRFTVHDGDSGEELSFCMYGQGSDKLDKGAYKAATGAEKYALLKLFMIPTGDDPEQDAPRRAEPPPPAGLAAIKSKLPPPSPPKAEPPRYNAATGEVPTHDRTLAYPFGSDKGKPISEVSDKSVRYWADRILKELDDPAQAQWRDNNNRRLTTLRAELAWRGL